MGTRTTRRSGAHGGAIILAVLILATGCANSTSTALVVGSLTTAPATAATIALTTAVTTGETSVDSTSASVSTSTPAPGTSVATPAFVDPVLATGPCALTPLGDRRSTITFSTARRLYELSADGMSAACVADLSAAPATSLSWSPSGAAVLLDGSRVLDGSGVRQTGYLAENLGVRWSYPTGKALVAPAVADGALLWRAAGDPSSRRDISFLARTDVVAYHAAGKNVFAVGVDAGGTAGVFVASNRGKNVKTVATLSDPATKITELAPDTSGAQLYILHDEGTKWEIHEIEFPSLYLGTVLESAEPLSHLTIGAVEGSAVAAQVGTCPGSTKTVAANWSIEDVGAGTPLASMSTTPIGWLDHDHLVVAARANGCSGPAAVWVVDASGLALQVLASVDSVSVRTAVASFGELPDDINAQAPG